MRVEDCRITVRRRLQQGSVIMAMLVGAGGAAASAHAATPAGTGGPAIPANAPSLASFEAASLGTYDPADAAAAGLVPLLDGSGVPVAVSTDSGVVGSAYLDPVGNVLVAYAWTATPAQNALATAILSGVDPAMVPGYADALRFLQAAQAAAAESGIAASRVYVTGFSLGGMLSSYAASRTGTPGASFAASGLPTYQAPAAPAANFVNFVEIGDPVSQYGTDTAERPSALEETPHMDHYGTVLTLGGASAQVQMAAFTALLDNNTVPQILTGSSPLDWAVHGSFDALTAIYHQMSLYSRDSDALALANGIDPSQP